METSSKLENTNAVVCQKDSSDLLVAISNNETPAFTDVCESIVNVESDSHSVNITDTCSIQDCFENGHQKTVVKDSDDDACKSDISIEMIYEHSGEDHYIHPNHVNTSSPICNAVVEEKLQLISDADEGLKLSQSQEVNDLQQEKTCPVAESDYCIPDSNIYSYTSDYPEYFFNTYSVRLVCRAWKEFSKKGENKFLKGCKWAPDGLCILTNCEDKKLRIFDLPLGLYTQKSWPKSQLDLLPDLKKTVQVEEGGRIYDYSWYPLMNSQDPPSCCFVSSATDEPVHLWDAFDGKLRASYQSRSYADEIISPFCVNFSPDGEKLFCGFKNKVHLFDVVYPGIKPTSFDIKALSGQSGLVSTIAFNPALPELFAVGTFQKSVGLYSSNDKCGICVLNGHSGGLTHMIFSHDGSCLYTGSRMDSEIVCWDLRNPGKVLFSLSRSVTTNQRIYFDITPDGRHLISGNTDGKVSIWNLENCRLMSGDIEPVDPDFVFDAHKDCSNGISINGRFPILATSSGQRHFPDILGDCDIDDQESSGNLFDCDSVLNKEENCLKLWWVGPVN